MTPTFVYPPVWGLLQTLPNGTRFYVQVLAPQVYSPAGMRAARRATLAKMVEAVAKASGTYEGEWLGFEHPTRRA